MGILYTYMNNVYEQQLYILYVYIYMNNRDIYNIWMYKDIYIYNYIYNNSTFIFIYILIVIIY